MYLSGTTEELSNTLLGRHRTRTQNASPEVLLSTFHPRLRRTLVAKVRIKLQYSSERQSSREI